MKRFFLLFVFVLVAGIACAQPDSLQRQINNQVWKPFIQSFNNRDDAGFAAVHSKDVIRVIQDANQIQGFDQYFRKVPDSIQARWKKWKRNIELRFVQRIASNGRAFEVGYYKTTNTHSQTGEKRSGYGKFHVLLRKENGVWEDLDGCRCGRKNGRNHLSFRETYRVSAPFH